jgi:hypothetical protein
LDTSHYIWVSGKIEIGRGKREGKKRRKKEGKKKGKKEKEKC